MSWDVSEVKAFAADLNRMSVAGTVKPVMSKAGLNMKTDARDAAKQIGPHARLYPYTIGYTITDGGLGVEVAPKPEGQGLLSYTLEYGSGYSKPHPHMIPALDKEAGPAADWLAKVLEDRLGGKS